ALLLERLRAADGGGDREESFGLGVEDGGEVLLRLARVRLPQQRLGQIVARPGLQRPAGRERLPGVGGGGGVVAGAVGRRGLRQGGIGHATALLRARREPVVVDVLRQRRVHR